MATKTVIKSVSKDRVLTINVFDSGKKPVFNFVGNWSGADLGVVKRHLTREYMMYVRNIRLQATNQLKGETDGS